MKFFIKIFFLLFVFNGEIFAQDVNLEALLGDSKVRALISENPDLMNQFINKVDDKAINKSDTSASAKTINSDHLKEIATIVQTNDTEVEELSILESYFKILTGIKLPIYGASEFNQSQKEELLFFNTFLDSYLLAPGDILRIISRGLNEDDELIEVGLDSKIILRKFAPIDITGLTIAELESLLTKLNKIDDASATVNASLSAARLVTIQISGDVDSPRTLAIPAYTPLSRIISYAGGISKMGSLRNIKVIHSNGIVENVDFYDFLQNPYDFNDPLLASNARIFIGQKGPTISVSGFVTRPGIYELPINETQIEYTKLLKMAGTAMMPPGVSIEALSFDENGILSSRRLKKGDFIYAGEGLHIGFIETANLNTISVKGAVHDEFSIPTQKPLSVLTALKSGAVLKNTAALDFAIIKTQGQPNTAISLSRALNDTNIKIPVGSTLFVYDQDEYLNLVSSYNKISNLRSLKDRQMIAELNNTALAEVYIDDELVSHLPPDTKLNLKSYQNILGASKNSMHFDLSLVSDLTGTTQTFAINLNSNPNFSTSENQIIRLFSKSYFLNMIKEFKSNNTSDVIRSMKESGAASIYLDGNLKNLIAPGNFLHTHKGFRMLSDEGNIYQLYATQNSYDISTAEWSDKAYLLNRFKDSNNPIIIRYKDRFDLFTKNFIRNDLFGEKDNNSIIIDTQHELTNISTEHNTVDNLSYSGANLDMDMISSLLSETDLSEDIDTDLLEKFQEYTNGDIMSSNSIKNGPKEPEDYEDLSNFKRNSSEIINIGKMRQASRKILGSVYFPGRYPIAEEISLATFIEQAGGFTERANLKDIELSIVENQGGNLVLISREKHNSDEIDEVNIPLTNSFALRINSLINDADLGTITINGEVNNPGNYRFSRGETVHDIIDRAGGFTNVAYPIGAIFNREKIRIQQIENNMIMANKIEKSILALSQTDIGNASGQASAILGFAMRLKGLPASGRMSVNVSLADSSAPVFLENNDDLFIPKRPSHVSIIGAVAKETVGIYETNKMIGDYFSDSGGLGKEANLKASFILLPNGQSEPLRKDTIVPPGSVLVVMPKTDRLSALGLSTIISKIMGNIATSILAINNVR
jgi:protein involved in polysaccharide export with SLBB domain